jgi:hypothetical protein
MELNLYPSQSIHPLNNFILDSFHAPPQICDEKSDVQEGYFILSDFDLVRSNDAPFSL